MVLSFDSRMAYVHCSIDLYYCRMACEIPNHNLIFTVKSHFIPYIYLISATWMENNFFYLTWPLFLMCFRKPIQWWLRFSLWCLGMKPGMLGMCWFFKASKASHKFPFIDVERMILNNMIYYVAWTFIFIFFGYRTFKYFVLVLQLSNIKF